MSGPAQLPASPRRSHSSHRSHFRLRGLALALAALAALAAGAAGAQTPIDALQRAFDEVARGLNYVGRRAGDLIPGLGLRDRPEAAHRETRPFAERLPCGLAPVVTVSNEFGAIRVKAWDERVVQVDAVIAVGADTADTAREIVQAIEVRVTPGADLVDIRTLLPDTRNRPGLVTMAVDYDLTVPRGAGVVTDNFFGDTAVQGVDGLVAVESRYGAVDLAGLGGEVKVRAQGEFPVRADGLARGGVFTLQGAQAEFARVGGALAVSSFRGSVLVRDLAPAAALDLNCDSGPLTVVLPAAAEPDLTVGVLYGTLESGLPLGQSAQGRRIVARLPKPEAAQRIAIAATFADVRIERPAAPGAPASPAAPGAQPFNDVVTRTETLPPGTPLRIEAMRGDLRIEGSDAPETRVTATRIVWAAAAAQAPRAIEAMAVESAERDGKYVVTTRASGDPGALGAASWRVDLFVQCPRGAPIEIAAEDGLTRLSGLDGAIAVAQTAGAVEAENTAGALTLHNAKGDVRALRVRGPIDARLAYGTLLLQDIAGPIAAEGNEARMILESPRAGVRLRNAGGDVRILALDGIGGPFDVFVESGALSLVMGPGADAALVAKTENGSVHSGIPLDGSIARNTQEFRGRLQNGTHPVQLDVKNGDILLD